jgi:hypothetical protein
MRIKLLKKMYRQTNDAIKRGDVFQQRPCPFYNEMHRIFSGIEDSNGSSLLSNSQSLLNDDEGEDEEIDDDDNELENENKISIETSNEDKFAQAMDRFIQYQKQNEVKISVFFFHMNFHQLYSFDRIVGINILNNKLIWNYNVDKKIEHINYN